MAYKQREYGPKPAAVLIAELKAKRRAEEAAVENERYRLAVDQRERELALREREIELREREVRLQEEEARLRRERENK